MEQSRERSSATSLHLGVVAIEKRAFESPSTMVADFHHHHVALVARISLTLSRHSSLSFIALSRSSGQHPVSSHSCWMYVRAGRPVFARPCVGVHKSTSLMSSSLLLQQCPACLARLTWIVFVIGGRWPYSWCLVGCRRLYFTYIDVKDVLEMIDDRKKPSRSVVRVAQQNVRVFSCFIT